MIEAEIMSLLKTIPTNIKPTGGNEHIWLTCKKLYDALSHYSIININLTLSNLIKENKINIEFIDGEKRYYIACKPTGKIFTKPTSYVNKELKEFKHPVVSQKTEWAGTKKSRQNGRNPNGYGYDKF